MKLKKIKGKNEVVIPFSAEKFWWDSTVSIPAKKPKQKKKRVKWTKAQLAEMKKEREAIRKLVFKRAMTWFKRLNTKASYDNPDDDDHYIFKQESHAYVNLILACAEAKHLGLKG